MKRLPLKTRWFWPFKVAHSLAASFGDLRAGCWNEAACYEFTAADVETLRCAAKELHGLYGQALDAVIQHNWWDRLGLSNPMAESVSASWARRDPALMGRFDLAWDGTSAPKLLEYNADTPMSLIEASLGQSSWHRDVCPESGQWNDIHASLVKVWAKLPAQRIHLAGCLSSKEDLLTLKYLERTAREAGKDTVLMPIKDLGWHRKDGRFVDLKRERVECLYKLYPWEWLWAERFSVHLPGNNHMFIEPAWRLAWNSKGMLPILWELFPHHPNLLPATDDPPQTGANHVKKPKLGREGANVTYLIDGNAFDKRTGPYGAGGFVYQGLAPDARLGERTATLGVWVIGDEPCGLGIREDPKRIVHGNSPFVPHRTV